MAIHAWDTGHRVDVENVRILRKGLGKTSERLLAESIEIVKAKHAVNRIDGVDLTSEWQRVLKSTCSANTNRLNNEGTRLVDESQRE